MGTYEGKTINVFWDIVGPNPLIYTANATDEMIQGYGGSDTIYGNGLDNYIFGDQRGDRDDFDPASDGVDNLYGMGGNDLINPGSGFGNYVNGGIGTDTLDYRDATRGQTVTVVMDDNSASAGTYGSTSFYQVENVYGTTFGRNVIGGDERDNELHGGNWGDVIRGKKGEDLIIGFGGKDELFGNGGSDRLQGGPGNDTLWGGEAHDVLIGGSGRDEVHGGRGHDRLIGATGNDTLYGNGGGDTIDGDAGNDVIVAGGGSDKLFGGSGSDRFVFGNGSNYNRIIDFESRDTIVIESGATKYSQLDFFDTNSGLRIEFANVEIFLKGLDMGDIAKGNFDFV